MLAADVASVEIPRAETRVESGTFVGRLAVRFLTAYLTIYIICNQLVSTLITWPSGSAPDIANLPVLQGLVKWTAIHVFGVTTELVITGSGSGDKSYDWVQAFCLLVFAVVVTLVWSMAPTRAERRAQIERRLRLVMRFTLGSTLIGYGIAKAIPLQMPYPPLTRLLEPYGHFSPMGVLWYSIGASRPYEMFTGCVEMSAGILLLIPHTAMLGALLGVICLTQVFALNMTYDVPVKLFSFHLLTMSLFLLGPDMKRLVNVFLLDRPATRSSLAPIGGTHGARRIAVVLQLMFAAYLVAVNVKGASDSWWRYGGGAPKSPLYGAWNVAYMSIDGVERAPLVTDYDRFRRVVFDTPARMAFQRMDDTFTYYGSTWNVDGMQLTLSKPASDKWSATLTFERPADDRLTLSGEIDGRKLEMRLELFPREKFLLVSRGFNWVQEYPFNR